MKIILSLIVSFCLLSVPAYSKGLEQYQVPGLDKLQIRQSDILPHIEQVKSYDEVTVKQLGQSSQQRPIYQFKVGSGKIKVLMWSQMHGDEPTATSAVFDLLNMLHQQPQWLAGWQDKISLYLVPMLNPDGAELAQRYNIQDIDINRDARRLQTPEGQILMSLGKSLQPDFGFNLHDQNSYYGAGDSGKTATISLLAPAYDHAKNINDSRRRAMQLIGVLKQVGDDLIPGHLGRYDDTFAPRAFGDNFSAMGISTILIESGAYPDDPNRQVARKVNLAMLKAGIDSIAGQSYQQQSTDAYFSIPMNNSNAFKDVIISQLQINADKQHYLLDVAIRLNKKGHNGRIIEVGDLSTSSAFYQFDAAGWQYRSCKSYALKSEPLELTDKVYLALLNQGYCLFSGNDSLLSNKTDLPVIFSSEGEQPNKPLRGRSAAFFMDKGNTDKIVLLNGSLINLKSGKAINTN